MMIERARVVAVEVDACWVETIARPGCGACASGQGCGGGVIGRLLGDRRHHLRIVLPAGLRPAVDDEVEIGVREHSVLRASVFAYLLPLAGIVAGAVTGGGLTVIANAPNPAGAAILKEHFADHTIAPGPLLLAAAPPTVVAMAVFRWL